MPQPLTETKPEQSSLPNITGHRWAIAAGLLSVILLTILICLPFLRAVYDLGDEAVLLNGAERMLHGEVLYKDFFEFLPPGGFVLTAWWFTAAGVSVWSARLLGVLTVTGVACFTYLASRQASRNAPLSAFLVIGWFLLPQGYLLPQLSHHWFTTLFSMMACWAALAGLQQKPRGLWGAVLAGAMEGAAVMVTPTCGALAWLAAATGFLRQGPAALLTYLAASALPPAFALAYLAAHGDLAMAYADFIRFTGAHYASIQVVPFGFGLSPLNYPLVCLFPVAAVLAVILCILKGRSCLQDRPLQLCLAFAIAGFIGCFPRPDAGRIGFAAPLALPLFAYCTAHLARRYRPFHAVLLFEALVVFCLPSARALWFVAQAALHTPMVHTPRGDIALIRQPDAADIMARIAALPPGEDVFFYPYLPFMSFLTGREQVSQHDLFTPGYTLPAQYQSTCLSVMQRADWVVIDRRWMDPHFLKSAFPAMQNASPPETRAFEQGLDNGFQLVAQSGTFELRHRRANASAALCTGIAG
jgi:hypothetical protein